MVRDGLVTYPGLPAPRVDAWLERDASRSHYAEGTTFHIGRVEMVANTGTYVDAPFHRFEGREDVAALPLDAVANLEAVVVRAVDGEERALGAELFDQLHVNGRAVLVHTGWSRHFGTEAYGSGHPFLTEAAARALYEAGARLVGIDSLNIDDTNDPRRPAHTLLLDAGIPIVEHLTNLDQLPDDGFRFFAPPVRFAGLGSFPVRAFALVG